jgi:hypothetical protein
LTKAFATYVARDQKQLDALASAIKEKLPRSTELQRKVAHYRRLLSPPEPQDAAALPATTQRALVADLKLAEANVGWGQPLRNQVLPDGDAGVLLEVAGKFYESGLYAHAPARHAIKLDKGWKTFSTKFGLQDGHSGSVVFVIKADGKELFRSQPVKDHELHEQQVSAQGVTQLELLVEDAGNGGNSDWGVWIEPRIER